ncbi:MAG: hypothetical protein J6C94_01285 [Alistipes sp.]|nr:hypothetical protein [Alistipes sp.]
MRKNLLLLLLAAMFTMVSCETDKTQTPREVDPFLLSLQGTWSPYTRIHYDEEWKEVIEVLIENGWCLLEGIGHELYTFNADGTITYYLEVCYTDEPFVETWPCFYDPESRIITVKNYKDEILREYLVSDYDGEYLTLDYKEPAYIGGIGYMIRCIRETLKRRQE